MNHDEKNVSFDIDKNGWIKLYRQLMKKAIWKCSTPEQKVILITLLLMADHEGNEWEWQGKKYKTEPGQFITSLKSIAEEAGKGISIQNVRTSLNKFKKYEFLTYESTKTGRLITIVNWHIYQGVEDEPNNEDNKDLTKTQQRPNKDLTPREEGKKDKKERMNYIYHEIYNHYLSLDLVKHKKFTPAMEMAIKTAMKNNGYSVADCKVLLDRHKKAVEVTKNSEYPIKKRPLHEFFGQKVYGGKHLICADYEEGGKYYSILEGGKHEKNNTESPRFDKSKFLYQG